MLLEVSDNFSPFRKIVRCTQGSTQVGRSTGYVFVDVRTPEEVEAQRVCIAPKEEALAVGSKIEDVSL
jgi:hypothetical protein